MTTLHDRLEAIANNGNAERATELIGHLTKPLPLQMWGVLPSDSDATPEDVSVCLVRANVIGMTHSAYLADLSGAAQHGRDGRLLQTFGTSAEDALAHLVLALYTNHPKEN